ncbi:heat shock protein 9/12-domain-containing protein [Pterulicium gracile]|uniref:Heat shock protein 9/12-domain-containing protein n=1 Tax=Pterulicium gracile TaxID=1884261 RepID=A0A5C3R1C2_9AGAR|nr:heat shock protein 9/12-domain-containing protein [Pterula gracilis]
MSDIGRQSLGDKAGAALKPDSQKTTTEQAGDGIKGTMDSVASTLQPQGEKSTSQKAGDTLSGNSNENSGSLLDKAKNAVGLGDNQPRA